MSFIVAWIVQTVGSLGYFGIFIMMFLESSFFPFPSEVVMIPAGYLSFKGEMNLVGVIVTGILGSIAGAWFNYYLAIKLGRKLLLKYGHYVFFTKETLEKVEIFFKKHGPISTLSGRLIPVIRQYVSLPAGLAHMEITRFLSYTGIGAGIWVSILALMGYYFGQNETLLRENLHIATISIVLLIVLIVVIYIWLNKRKERKYLHK